MGFDLLIKYISSNIVLLPVLTGLSRYRKIPNSDTRYFIFYLLLGFITDQLNPSIVPEITRVWIYNFYILVEVLFILWFLRQHSLNKPVRLIIKSLMVMVFFFWIICHAILLPEPPAKPYSALFNKTTAIIVSSFAAFFLLEITKSSVELTTLKDFWFLTGIFFYFFCVVFIFALINDKSQDKFWFIHDIFNIIAYFIYTKAFLVVGKGNSK